jgi:hypothetical protein
MPVAAREIVHHRRQVFIPIYEQMQKFVRTGQNWRDRETESQNLKCLIVVLILGRA